uniref:ER membrane protein complex subunit 2 n=1 Tax=Chromera velia CCMP2878 TaxID=1169474 RepID=A0A0G4IAG3_9ALVE|mmetsp:Transcript_745/g.1654  ORF Transcript_745/g.1654 Transcript_745/m.1654 type:complete len:279 (+) Transcript_745:221-1057(+)|eukprot:Cvel_12545.t1-p1 / transcript=Cvel_12545.t1 / gene=Cvel_12545 / organism=Chromera_velia_CCMP2878 / gene_product=ER membrane protein complex subunit 2, putative / transcript_product=ER membrane protein complex subunit 2, putative / location=Cvel_scaffold824:44318-45151(-) / protein_length=278 / sequence_SO=supercontig / SO=protein_coding / is_pseudo=false
MIPVSETKSCSYKKLLDSFKAAARCEHGDLLLSYGTMLLVRFRTELGDEFWTVCERVLLAALDFGATEWVDFCLAKLRQKFPQSVRVKKLAGLVLESREDLEGALRLYNDVKTKAPTDVTLQKRTVTVLKKKRRFPEAVDKLKEYLDEFPMDIEAWHELGCLYLYQSNLPKAVFCFEELMLHDPRNVYFVLTIAELLYSTGDFENSRRYFAWACQIDDKCLRGLWGLLLASEHLKGSKKGSGQLESMATEKILAIYSRNTTKSRDTFLPLVQKMLQSK